MPGDKGIVGDMKDPNISWSDVPQNWIISRYYPRVHVYEFSAKSNHNCRCGSANTQTDRQTDRQTDKRTLQINILVKKNYFFCQVMKRRAKHDTWQKSPKSRSLTLICQYYVIFYNYMSWESKMSLFLPYHQHVIEICFIS